MTKKQLTQTLIPIIALILSFFAGMEYKAYQIRSTINDAFGEFSNEMSKAFDADSQEKQKEEVKQNTILIQKEIGEDVELSTLKFKVNSSEEKTIIENENPYIKPIESKEDTKLVLINLDVTNTTNREFYFDPEIEFLLVDDQEREFSMSGKASFGLDNYIARTLSPSIKENGFMVFEIPKDSIAYGLIIEKAETNEVYIVRLK